MKIELAAEYAGALSSRDQGPPPEINDPNEGRLPRDQFGAELWEADRG